MSTRMQSINVAPGAVMCVPRGDLEWMVRYGNVVSVRYIAASVIDSYAYLVGPEISTAEAIRRLRILRAAPPEERKP